MERLTQDIAVKNILESEQLFAMTYGPGYHFKSGPAPAGHTSGFSFYCFASAAATHIVQATHANAKTKAYSKSVAAPVHCE